MINDTYTMHILRIESKSRGSSQIIAKRRWISIISLIYATVFAALVIFLLSAADFKSRQTASTCTYIPCFFFTSVLFISTIPRGDFAYGKRSAEKCRLFHIDNGVIGGLLAALIFSIRFVSHPATSILRNITVRGPSLKATIVHGVNHTVKQRETGIYFPWHFISSTLL